MAALAVSHRTGGHSGEDPLLEERLLIQRAQAGELGAFDHLVLKHQDQVYAVALRMLWDPEEAEDVAQEAFVRAYRTLGTFRGEAKFSTWVIAITMNLCRNRRRWWARRKQYLVASLEDPAGEERTIGEMVADPNPTPADAAQSRERREFLLNGLQKLGEQARAVIVLRDIEGYSYEKIAGTLRCQVGTVKSRLNRARLQLRAILDGRV